MLLSAILVALIAILSNWWVSHLLTRSWLYPIISGFLVALALGSPIEGMKAAAYINLSYLGWMTVGGTMPGNLPVASVFGTAMTILSGAAPSTAVVFAVPFSLLGILTFQASMSFNALWVHKAEAMLDRGNITGMRMMNYIPSFFVNMVLVGIPAFCMVYFGADFMKNMLTMIPQSLVNAFEVIGGIMPALGIAMLVSFLGKKRLMPFFFLGFFLVAYLNLGIMAIAVFAVIAAVIMNINAEQKVSATKG
ncbi:PTS sugar transporter subunit IIC [Salmonella enterica subsp. enterica serovar Agona]|uniref:PTS mannose/fructose/sorbose/N-acetylgalactosamine transporter subunit IIC n=1 Tax=Salmonella enterica TaxID=28901 RepID=UPI000FA8DB04|nr:PTS sugar transporter subunit IIC [Salmonella enterica]EEN7371198.1 PTS sugar transporter subunit IIC [Salmonella enterica subsp. enterica]EAB7500001.1 PTS sugar transporter subunit IIC [Salmonella enterica subsp. enterica serovar Agona]EAQ9250661.1 PTS sugar transporter subunit IIC [Salmonella enterica]EBA7921914.1 PTS sugar transporter subunit IIC [Salmonella enterica]EBG0092781.1 PTS sugar transporter subunit IIC [Salmonella enterica subsp. enterica serovar Agona]